MNRILLRKEDLVCDLGRDNLYILAAQDHRARHLREILKAKPGQFFESGLLQTQISGSLEICEIRENGTIVGHFSGQYDEKQKLRWQKLSLGLGIPRPPVLKRLLRDLASAGLEQISLIQTDLCEGDYCKSHIWDELEQYLVLGAEQGRVNRLPRLRHNRRGGISLGDFLEESKQFRSEKLLLPQNCVVLEEGGQARGRRISERDEPYLIALGPERGWTAGELQAFQDSDFQNYSLGPLTLRTEVAAHLALGLYLLETQVV